jgi:alpha-glucosidase
MPDIAFRKALKNYIELSMLIAALLLAGQARSQAVPNAKLQLKPDSEIYNSVADPGATVLFGNARFTVLTSQLIRLEWAADGKFEDRASFTFLNRRLPAVPFHTILQGDTLTLDTSDLHLIYKGGAEGERFTANNLSIEFRLGDKEVHWHPGSIDSGNLLGTAHTLDMVKGDAVQLESGLLSRTGWTVVDDSARPLFDSADFSMSKGRSSTWPWVVARPTDEHVDLYFFGYGHHYEQALSDFVRIAGRIPLPPRFAFGNWWSRYWAYSDQDIEQLASGFRTRDIPLDVFVIDIDWHLAFPPGELDQSGHRKGWSGYTWNRDLFPEPTQFLQCLHHKGLKVALNLHPASGVQPWEDAYLQMAQAMGQDPAAKKYVPLQITQRQFVNNYFDLLHHPLEKQGVDFWWLDWQQEDTTDIAGVNPTFWLNYLHFMDQKREGKRPLLFHRWGGLGNHRYQIGFSGDVLSSWESLKFQPSFTATAANVGYAYWSHDIGGHVPGPVDAELYTRWLQWGAFSPILRTHTTKGQDAERRVWAYPEPFSDVMADTLRLRYRWVPYIYTEARRTYDTGVALLRPLYYRWPEVDEAYNSPNEFLFGDEVLVAPVTSPMDPATQLATEHIWLPPGEWIEQSSGTRFSGPIKIDQHFSIEQVPLYVRPGTIIPMQPPMLQVGAKPVDPLIVQISPLNDHQVSSYDLYEDSSEDRKYMHGEFTTTALHAARNGSSLTVTIDAVRGSYPGMVRSRAVRVELPDDWPPSSVTVNGRLISHVNSDGALGWRYAGDTLTTCILTKSFVATQPITIKINRDSSLLGRTTALDGFAGKIAALRRAYAQISDLGFDDDLIVAMQTGGRMTYHPDHARVEVERLPLLISSAQKKLEIMAIALKKSDYHTDNNGTLDSSPEANRKQIIDRRIGIARVALAGIAM